MSRRTPGQAAACAARFAKYEAEMEAGVEAELAKPEAQGPLPPEAERVIASLLANRKRPPLVP